MVPRPTKTRGGGKKIDPGGERGLRVAIRQGIRGGNQGAKTALTQAKN